MHGLLTRLICRAGGRGRAELSGRIYNACRPGGLVYR